MTVVEIDGSIGEGGGQIVRTAVGLAAAEGRALSMVNVRENRSSTGLRPQHVAAIDAVAQACEAETEHVEVGSTRFSFDPGEISGGRVRVDTGTAANTILVVQALVPLSRELDEPMTVQVCGGTDVKYAPTLTYFEHVFCPWARRLGVPLEIETKREGFYPVGGGELSVTIGPRETPELDEMMLERGELRGVEIRTRVSELPDHIPERINRTAKGRLSGQPAPVHAEMLRVDADCAGVVVDTIADFGDTVLGANALGEKGLPSETVAKNCVGDLLAELASPATVDVHLADQLVPLLVGLKGAGYRTREESSHLSTNVQVVRRFCPDAVEIVDATNGFVVRSLG
jgi:RNA 3'-phosphate cyclase